MLSGSMGLGTPALVMSLAFSGLMLIGWGTTARRRCGAAEWIGVLTVAMVLLVPARSFRYVLPLAPLFSRMSRTLFAVAEELDSWSVNVSRQIASRELIDDAHDLGYRVLVYTVNDAHESERLKEWGVDGIFTDRPDLLRELP